LLTADILVVDDTPESLKVLIEILQNRGYRVRPAASGRRALASATKAAPDLILLDVCMPEMSGFELCRLLKQEESTKNIPIIFLSALDDTEDKLRAFQEGGLDYITKPFQEAEVVARIETQLTILRQRRQIEADYQRLLQMEKMRDTLTHMLVHDLRAPLTGIVGYIHVIERSCGLKFNELSLDCIQQVKGLSSRMVEMISMILDVSRLEANELPLSIVTSEMVGLVRDSIQVLGNEEIAVEGSPRVTVDCDPELMRRVFTNLLSNALRYSPPDKKVRVHLTSREGEVEARVCDYGKGIPPEEHDRIFEKFAQVERQGHHSGLGLAFCKLVVEKHGGRIGVDSQVGDGSQFWVRLPATSGQM
jgi:two-component system sensor histidine kinase/response regulator